MGKKAPSLKLNTLANYAGQVYATFIGIVIFPFYLHFLGAEAYGLVGFYMVLLTWFGLLDVGLTPVLNREVAQARAKPEMFDSFRLLLRTIEVILSGLLVVIGCSIFFGSGWLANHWLKIETLDISVARQCIEIMGIMIGLRFFSAIYRSGMAGMEAQVWLNTLQIITATLRSFGSLAVLAVKPDPLAFFVYQLAVMAVEVLAMRWKFYALLPAGKQRLGFAFSLERLRPALPFGLSSAYGALAWVIISQLDKLALSTILPLKEYGYFSLVAVLVNGVMMIAHPIGGALMPRMTYLHSKGETERMFALYRKATQLVAVIMLPLAGMVGLFGLPLLYAWTGNMEASQWGSPILFWYMLGNMALALLSFQYYMQYAHGKLEMHVKMNTAVILLAAPAILYAAYNYGAEGTGVVWFVLQVGCLLLFPLLVHRRFAPGLHKEWWLKDIMPVAACAFAAMAVMAVLPMAFLTTLPRPVIFAVLIAMGMAVLGCAALGSSFLRGFLMSNVFKLKRTIS